MVEFKSYIVIKQPARLSAQFSASNMTSVAPNTTSGTGGSNTPQRRTPTQGMTSTKQVTIAPGTAGAGGNGYLTYEISQDHKTLTIHDVDSRQNEEKTQKSMKAALAAHKVEPPKPKQSSMGVRRGLGAWHSFGVEKVFLVEPNTEFNVSYFSFKECRGNKSTWIVLKSMLDQLLTT